MPPSMASPTGGSMSPDQAYLQGQKDLRDRFLDAFRSLYKPAVDIWEKNLAKRRTKKSSSNSESHEARTTGAQPPRAVPMARKKGQQPSRTRKLAAKPVDPLSSTSSLGGGGSGPLPPASQESLSAATALGPPGNYSQDDPTLMQIPTFPPMEPIYWGADSGVSGYESSGPATYAANPFEHAMMRRQPDHGS